MRIPTWGDGAAPAPVQHTRIGNPAGAVAEATDRLAGIAGNIAQAEMQHVAQERDDLARAKAANLLLDHEIAAKTTAQKIGERVATGEIDYHDAEKEFDSEVDQLPQPDFSKVDPAYAEVLQGGMKRIRFNVRSDVTQAVEQARRADFKSQSADAIDKLRKLAGMPGADIAAINTQIAALAPLVARAGLDPKVIQDAQDANWTTEVEQRVIANQGNMAGLQAIQADLTSDKGRYFDKLDADKRTAAWRSVQTDISQLQTRQQAEADKRESTAATVMTKAQDDVVTGVPLSPERWQKDLEAVKGTTHEAAFRQVMAQADEIQTLQAMPFAQQEARINEIEAQFKSHPSDDPSAQQTRINTLRRVLDEGRKLAKDSPITFAQYRTGQNFPPIDFSAMASGDTRAVVEQLQGRFVAIGALRHLFGNDVGLNPWRPEEANALAEVMARTDDKGKLTILSAIAAAAPDPRGYAGALAPLATKDRVSMLAGMAQLKKLRSSSGIEVAPTLLAGQRILADKSVPMPNEAKMRAAFETRMGAALPDGSQQRADAYLAFKALYAGMAGPLGVRHDGAEPDVVPYLAGSAFNVATGGTTEAHGRQVLLPYGMDADTFSARLQTELGRVAAASGFDEGDLEDMPLMAAPGVEGGYFLLNGNSVQLGADGKPLMVKLR